MFYNGTETQPEKKTYRLSELFEKPVDKPELELMVTVLNINDGYNTKLLSKCETLCGYMKFVNKVRDNKKNRKMNTEEAVINAVDTCIREGILADFFQTHKEEVIGMGIFEFDEELYKEAIQEDGIELGFQKGLTQGTDRVNRLNQCLCDDNRTEDLMRSVRDSGFQQKLLKEYGL